MNNAAPDNQTTRRVLAVACAAALAVAVTVSLPQAAHAERITPPPVPANIEVRVAGSEVFLEGHGVGTQNYVCLPSGSGFAWSLFTPQATLFNDDLKQVTTHFFSPNQNPNPTENGTVRAAWQHSRDTSTVWARMAVDGSSSDPDFVAAGAIPWLLLDVAGVQEGPTGGDTLTATTSIQRLNTAGGVAPSTGCSLSTDVGNRAFIPYTADYFFYRGPESDEDDDNSTQAIPHGRAGDRPSRPLARSPEGLGDAALCAAALQLARGGSHPPAGRPLTARTWPSNSQANRETVMSGAPREARVVHLTTH